MKTFDQNLTDIHHSIYKEDFLYNKAIIAELGFQNFRREYSDHIFNLKTAYRRQFVYKMFMFFI